MPCVVFTVPMGWFLLLSMTTCAVQAQPAASFHGVNWADRRDNFVDGPILPSGLVPTQAANQLQHDAEQLMKQLQEQLGINTVRLGINPPTVSDQVWWPKYRAVIQACTQRQLRVILACWESHSGRDGKIDNHPAFDQMWDQVVAELGNNDLVYFEIFNEPFGYRDADWRALAAAWIDRQEKKIAGKNRERILVSGSGYNERLVSIGRDPRFAGCLLSFHLYAWFGGRHTTVRGWRKELEQRIGPANMTRTIVTEWGAPMATRPADYYTLQPADGRPDRAFLAAMAGLIHDRHLGSLYWPGLRDGDNYSLFRRHGKTLTLQPTNPSGLELVRWSYGALPAADSAAD